MTMRETRRILKSLGFRLKKNEHGDFVLFGYGIEYHTNDLNDAVETAKLEYRRCVLKIMQ